MKNIYKIGDIASLFSGGDAPNVYSDIKTKQFCIPIYSNGINNEGLYGYTDKPQINGDSITISARGTVGVVFYRKENFYPIVRLISIVPNKKIVNTKYLYYYLKSCRIEGFGTSQQQLTIPFFSKYKISIYSDLYIQQKIADILSKYDDFIENNNKRIKLLEQTAQNLYKEWFVRFRFPNYKKTKFIKGIPEGWKVERIKDQGKVITGKTPSTKITDYYGDYCMFVKTPDMNNNFLLFDSQEKLSLLGSESQIKCLIPKNSIMVSCIGTAGIVAINIEKAHTNQQINSIILNDIIKLEWLFFTLKSLKQTIEMYGNTGTTMCNLSKNKFEKLKIFIPTKLMIEKFSFMIKPIFKNILNLQKQNQNLIKQRDLLLPRLMSGKLEV